MAETQAQPQQGDETILEEAKNLLVQGKRCMALEDYQSATDFLEQSCQLFDAFYGVAKRECADAYLEYGLALVALANLEAGSGTDKIMKKAGIEEEEEEDDEDEEQEGEDEEQEEDDEEAGEDGDGSDNTKKEAADKTDKVTESQDKTTTEPTQVAKTTENGHSTNGHDVEMKSSSPEKTTGESKTNGVSSNGNNITAQEQPTASSSSTSVEPTPGTSGDSGDKEDNDDDVDNEEATTIEIAWEVLCLAKRLYMTDESLEGRLKLAETLQKIGEISIEWDNNDNAVSILEECLKIRTAILQPDDRLIALTYYNLGLAHSFKSDTQNANENFQNAINVIEKRIMSLTGDLEKAKASQDTVAIGSYQKEINELKELLPDMTMRIDDSKEDSTNSTEALKRTREEMQMEDDEVKKVCLDKSKPVDDISHLVKRKAA